jgi:hypothetical protein
MNIRENFIKVPNNSEKPSSFHSHDVSNNVYKISDVDLNKVNIDANSG